MVFVMLPKQSSQSFQAWSSNVNNFYLSLGHTDHRAKISDESIFSNNSNHHHPSRHSISKLLRSMQLYPENWRRRNNNKFVGPSERAKSGAWRWFAMCDHMVQSTHHRSPEEFQDDAWIMSFSDRFSSYSLWSIPPIWIWMAVFQWPARHCLNTNPAITKATRCFFWPKCS